MVTGVVTLDEAISPQSIDYKTLLLLFGMMIVVGALRLSGFFERLTGLALRHIATPSGMLAATIGLSGLLSAFLINDVVCVAMTPLVLHVARRLKFDPLPHLIGLATAANIGSTGTITGNPQNIYIGAHSGISYLALCRPPDAGGTRRAGGRLFRGGAGLPRAVERPGRGSSRSTTRRRPVKPYRVAPWHAAGRTPDCRRRRWW